MKLAVTASSDQGLKAKIDSRFGRAPYFIIVDVDTMKARVIDNSASNAASNAASGAGISAAQTVANEGVNGVISGNFGPKAFSGLKAGDLKLYSFPEGTVKEAINEFKKGTLEELSNPTSGAHAGLNR